MIRWTLTTRDGGIVHGYEANAILAYKTAKSVALTCPGGAVITVDDAETTNTLDYTEDVAENLAALA